MGSTFLAFIPCVRITGIFAFEKQEKLTIRQWPGESTIEKCKNGNYKRKNKMEKKNGRENKASPSVWIWKKDRNGKLKKKKKRTEEGFRERTYWQVTTFIKELFLVD